MPCVCLSQEVEHLEGRLHFCFCRPQDQNLKKPEKILMKKFLWDNFFFLFFLKTLRTLSAGDFVPFKIDFQGLNIKAHVIYFHQIRSILWVIQRI